MNAQIVPVYWLCEDLLKALGRREDPQGQMSQAEVMTTALVAAMFFGGTFERARKLLLEQGSLPGMLSKGRFNVRLHALPQEAWMGLFHVRSTTFKDLKEEQEYLVESFPVPGCDPLRIRRGRSYQEEAFRGKIASKRRFFYGLRGQLLVPQEGQPVEFMPAPGSWTDVRVLKHLALDLPEGAKIHADRVSPDYGYEALLKDVAGILLVPLRKKNSKRAVPPWVEFVRKSVRNRGEPTASQITAWFPKVIHAVTAKGFELQVMLFVMAFAIQCL